MTIMNEQMFEQLIRVMPDEQLKELQQKLTSELQRRGLEPTSAEPEHLDSGPTT